MPQPRSQSKQREGVHDTSASRSLRSDATAALLKFLVLSVAALAVLALPKVVDAQYSITVSGSTVTFTSDGSGGTLTLGEQNGRLSHNASAASTSESNVGVDLSQVTEIIINGGSGDDRLVINNPAGSVFAPNAVIRYNGGEGYDTLVIQGGGGADFQEVYCPGPTKDAGLVLTTNGTVTQTINFTGLEPVQDNVPSGTVTVSGNNASNSINYSKGPGGGIFVGNTGLVSVDNLETFEFNNKTNLVINGQAGSDNINLHYDNTTNPAGLTGTITVNGGDPTDSDTLTVNGLSGALDNLRYLPNSVGAGTVVNDSAPQPNVLFTGIEHLHLVIQQSEGDGIRVEGTTGNDAIEYSTGQTSDSGSFIGTMDQNNATGAGPFTMTPMTFTGAFPLANDADINFFNPGGTDSIVFNGTAVDDAITIQTGEAGGTDFRDTVNGIVVSRLEVFNVASGIARGLAGNNKYNLNLPAGPAGVTLSVEGGSSNDTINYNPPAGSATTVDYRAATITTSGANPVSFSGIEAVNENSSGATSSLIIQGSNGPQTVVYSPIASGVGTVSGSGPTLNFTGVGQLVTFNGHDPAKSDVLVANAGSVPPVLEPTAQNAGTVTYYLSGLPNLVFTGIGRLEFHGNASIPFGIDGTTGNDQFVYTSGATPDTGTLVGTMKAGVAQFPLVPVTFTGIEQAGVVVFNVFGQQGGTDSFVFNGTPVTDNISVAAGGVFGGATLTDTVNGALTADLNLNNMASATVHGGGGGSDVFSITGVLPFSTLTIDDGATANFNGASGPVTAALGNNVPNSANRNTVITGYGGAITLIDINTANLDANNQQVTATSTTQNDNIIYTPTGATAGTFYDTLGSGNNLVPNTVFNIANAAGNFKVFNDPAGNADEVTLRGTDARDLFEINQGSGVAQVLSNNVTALLPVELGISSEILNVRGEGGQNTFQVIPAPGLVGQAQDNLLVNVDGGTTGANNVLVIGSSFGNSPGQLAANQFVVVNRGVAANSGTARVFTSAVANPDINYKHVQVVSPNVAGGNVNPNLLVIGPDLNEPNEQLGTAAFIGSGQVQHATIFPNSTELPGAPPDNDYYRVVAQSSGTMAFNVFFRLVNPTLLPVGGNLTLQVLDSSGNIIATGSNQASITATAGQSYYLHVLGASSASVNGYDVSVTNSNQPITVQGIPVTSFEGVPFTNAPVASFQSVDTSLAASNFTATINWGDGTAFTSGSLVNNGGGSFTIRGSHTYAEEGSFNVAVTIHDVKDNYDATANTSATVGDAPLSISGAASAGTSQTFSGVGGNNAAGGALNAFNAFKAAIGGVDNGAVGIPQAGGFRTINWDAVALAPTDGIFTNQVVNAHTVGIPVNRFQTRGMNFEEVYAVSDDGFASVNPGVAGQFNAFSPTKTFAMFDENTIDFNFVLPAGATTPPIQAASRGFGAIFLDVETDNTTSVELFSGATSLGKFFVPKSTTSGDPEFLGVLFQNPAITSVHIELGNAQLFSFDGVASTPGAADNPPTTDLVATDDFAYAEPGAFGTGINITASVGQFISPTVASFTDADPKGQVGDYTAIIDWGDGTTSSGTITPNASGGFDVTGSHTYLTVGVFHITTVIRDIGGSSVSGTSTAIIGGQSILGSLQFSTTAVSANENAGSAVINVTRTGDTSVPASVQFQTSDGTAKQKTDYTFGFGIVQFAAGETTKQINVLLVNDNFVEGPENFFVTLLNPSTNFVIGTLNTVAVTINDDDVAPSATNPIDNAQFFVRQHYLDFLGREADAPGLTFWTNQITACGANPTCIADARINVSAAFFLSIEFQETGGFVLRTQRAAFGRQSTDSGQRVPYTQFMHDTRLVGAGVIVNQPGYAALLESNKQAYATAIVNDPAFQARYPVQPAASFVDALFTSAAVTPTAAERTAAINAFGAGGIPGRVAALRSVADSSSLRQAEMNPSFVLAEYYGYLRRNPTDAPDFSDAGYQFWLAKLNAFNGDFTKAEMVKAFILSSEYRSRFGTP